MSCQWSTERESESRPTRPALDVDVRIDRKQSSVRHWPGMRSEYTWLPPDDAAVTTTKPYQVGVSFSAHTKVAYERDGHARYLDIPAGAVFATGVHEVRWYDVTEPTEALEIYPDLDLVRAAVEPSAADVIEIQPAAAAHDATVLGLAAVLKRAHVNGSALDDLEASALAHRLAAHLADHYCWPRSRRSRRVGRLDRGLVERLVAYIEDRLDERLVLDDLATEARLSAFHFARAFKNATGMAPHEFVTMRRMERAKALLLATRDSVPEIAYAVGYSNVGHFRRLFRRYTGFAPYPVSQQDSTLRRPAGCASVVTVNTSISTFPLMFSSGGAAVVGRVHRRAESLTERQPAVLITGSWLTVKEQMADLYAGALAARGYTAITYDFIGFGQSGGELRQVELPNRKIADITAAARFASTLSFVEPGRVGHLGVCASAQYALAAIAQGAPIQAFASVAGWFHDTESVAPFYGGNEGVRLRLQRGQEALDRYVGDGDIVTVPAYEAGNDRAGMSLQLDYYAEPTRGAIPEWRNEMAEMSWIPWLTFDGLASASAVTVPTLFVHADGCVFPDHIETLRRNLSGPVEVAWGEGTQIDFYDQPDQVGFAVDALDAHFAKTLGGSA